MAFRSSTYVVNSTTTPVVIYTAEAGDVEVWVKDSEADQVSLIGGPELTTANGFTVGLVNGFHSEVRVGDELWAMLQSNTVRYLHVLVRSI